MTHQVVDGLDSGYLEPDYMRLQLQNQGFLVDDNMLHHNQMHDGGFQVDNNMFSQDHMADGGYHIDDNMLYHNQMNNGEYAIDDDFEMTDAQTMDGTVPADGTFSSHEENRVHAADNDIEMLDEGMMDEGMMDEGMMDEGMMNGVISADNAISPQGEDRENKVCDDADENAIIAAPAPNDHMNQYRIMFLVSQNMQSLMIMFAPLSRTITNFQRNNRRLTLLPLSRSIQVKEICSVPLLLRSDT